MKKVAINMATFGETNTENGGTEVTVPPLENMNYLRDSSRASIFLMGSMMEPTLISWLMAATK
jgi:hypothetical protein